MADIIQPTFNPAYVPMEGKPDSILIACHDADTNVFTYNAWDGYARWFELVKDGEVAFAGGMEVGDSFLMNNSSDWVVRYFVNEVYEYKVVNGKCDTEATTTTQPTVTVPTTGDSPSTTSLTVPDSTSTSTTEPETSSTTSPPETTTSSTPVTPTTESSDTAPTTAPTNTSLGSGPGRPEIMMDCRWDNSMSQFLRADGGIMTYEECSEAATPVEHREELAYSGSMTLLLAIIAAVVIVIGALAWLAGHRRRLTKKVGSLFDRSSTPVSTGF